MSPLLEFSKRVYRDWEHLADHFVISPLDRAGFARSREPQELVQWLKDRQRLSELPQALTAIGREDLLGLAQEILARSSEPPAPEPKPTVFQRKSCITIVIMAGFLVSAWPTFQYINPDPLPNMTPTPVSPSLTPTALVSRFPTPEQTPAETADLSKNQTPEVLWVGTRAGVSRYRPSDSSWKNFNPPTGYVYSIYQDVSGNFWFGTDKGIFHFFYDPSKDEMRQDPSITQLGWIARSIHQDRSGTIWFGLKDDLAWRSPSGAWLSADHPPGKNRGVFVIHEDRNGILWFGIDHGLVRHDPTSKIPPDLHGANPLGGTWVLAIQESHDGKLWLGTLQGAILFDPGSQKELQRLLDIQVNAIGQEIQGALWLGTNNGATRCYPETGKCDPSVFKGSTIRSIHAEPSGQIWFGMEKGLKQFNPYQEPIPSCDAPPGLPDLFIHTVIGAKEFFVWPPSTLQKIRQDYSGGAVHSYFRHSGKCLAQSGGSTNLGEIYTQAECRGDRQQFHFNYENTKTIRPRFAPNGPVCMQRDSKDVMRQQACDDSNPNQLFERGECDGPWCKIKLLGEDMCLSVENDSVETNARISLRPCAENRPSMWISMGDWNHDELSWDKPRLIYNKKDGAHAYCIGIADRTNPDRQLLLRGYPNLPNLYLSTEGCNIPEQLGPDGNRNWNVSEEADGKARFKDVQGRCLGVNGANPGTFTQPLSCDDPSVKTVWKLIPVPGDYGYYYIQLWDNPQFCLMARDESPQQGHPIFVNPCESPQNTALDPRQRWSFRLPPERP